MAVRCVSLLSRKGIETGYLYIIRFGTQDVFKVGITDGEPLHRLRTLQTGSPVELSIHKLYNLPDARNAEKNIHNALQPHRLIGEWFAVNQETVENTVNRIVTTKNGKNRSMLFGGFSRYFKRNKRKRTTGKCKGLLMGFLHFCAIIVTGLLVLTALGLMPIVLAALLSQ